jgi:glycolate oxidase iron-sulfur subunit
MVGRIADAKPDYVLSSNVGCAMHLAAGLRRAGVKAEVASPLVLLARQLGGSATG